VSPAGFAAPNGPGLPASTPPAAPEQPPVARARVRVDQAAARAGGPGAEGRASGTVRGIRPLLPPGSFGRVPIGLLVWWQVLGAAVLVVIDRSTTVLVAVATVAVVLAVPPAVRARGRSLPSWAVLWLRYLTRSRRLVRGRGDVRVDLLTLLEPDLSVDMLDLDGTPIGTVAHPWGLAALVELFPHNPTGMVGEAVLPSPPTALLPADLLPSEETSGPPVTVSMVTRLVPAPLARLHGSLVAEAYHEFTGSRVPADRQVWLAVQVRRTPSVYTDDDLGPALIAAVRRLQRKLRRDKIPVRPLDRSDLLAATARLASLDVGAGTYGTARERPLAQETWGGMTVGAVSHSCYRLVRWPAPERPLDPLLCALPVGVATTGVAVTRPTAGSRDAVAAEVVIRLSDTDPRQLRAGERALRAAVRDAGGSIARLHGEQRWGFAATLPFGGLLR
jgi:type VII secretion protein EccE